MNWLDAVYMVVGFSLLAFLGWIAYQDYMADPWLDEDERRPDLDAAMEHDLKLSARRSAQHGR